MTNASEVELEHGDRRQEGGEPRCLAVRGGLAIWKVALVALYYTHLNSSPVGPWCWRSPRLRWPWSW